MSLRRSTINVENVGGRLWQSSYNMSAGIRPQCLLFTGSPRFARDDKGGLIAQSRVSFVIPAYSLVIPAKAGIHCVPLDIRNYGVYVYFHYCGLLLYQWFPACYHPTNTFVFVGARCRDDGVSMHVTSASRALLPPRPNHPRDTPRGARCVGHPSNGGELGSYRRGTSSPLRRGGGLPPGWFITRSLGEGWSITSNELRVTSN